MVRYLATVRGGREKRRLGGAMIALLVGVVLSCGSLSEEEVTCEEAVSLLEDCCPKLDAQRFSCSQSCSGDGDFTERAISCIRERSCTQLQDRGICTGLTRLANEPYPSRSTDAIQQEACK